MSATSTSRGAAWRARVKMLPRRRELEAFAAQLRGPLRWSALRALIDAGVVSYTLRRRGVGALNSASGSAPTRVDAARSRDVAVAVDAAFAMWPLVPTCLRRSVTLSRELHRLGLRASTHVGVHNDGGRVAAHAWVQVGDEVVNDDPSVTERYTPLLEARWSELVPILR